VSGESDEILVARSLEGKVSAFGELVTRYERVVYTVALRMSGNAEDARDVTQSVFLKAWRGLGGFDPRRRFFSWIYRISVHECLNHRRGRARFEPLMDVHEAVGPGPEQSVETHETEQAVQGALARLSAGDREILILRHFLDQSYEDIAATLGTQEKTVKSRLFAARQRLRAELARSGVQIT